MAEKREKNKALSSGIWFTVSNFIMKSIGFITTPIFARLLTKAEYGDFNNFQVWMMILMYITSLNLEASLLRASQEFKQDMDRYVFSMITLSWVSTAFWWIVYNIFRGPIISVLSMDDTYINCMFMYLLLVPAVSIFQHAERFKFKYKWTVASSLTVSIGSSLLSVLLVLVLPDRLFGRTIGYIIPTIIIGLVISVYYLVKVKSVNFKYWKYALPITIPYIPHLLSIYLLSNMDRAMIKKMCGPEDLALYSMAYTCGILISILVNSVNSAFSPWLAEKLAKKEYDRIRAFSVPYVAIFSFVALGAVLVTPEILYILGGSSYMEAKYVMPPVAGGCLLQFVYCMYVNIEQFEKKTVGMAIASVIAALLNFILNYIFIDMFGYIAAAYTTYVGYFSLLIMHMFLVKRLGMFKVYNNRVIFLIALLASLLMFSVTLVLDHTVVRYIVLAVYIAVAAFGVYKYRDKIKGFLKK